MRKQRGGSEIISLVTLILAMSIFGTIGLLRKFIPLPSGTIALVRGAIGTVTLLLVMLITRKKPDFGAIRRNLWLLLASGVFLGFNWVLLFEACEYTTVATATLCYYMAPMIVVAVSPFLLGEKMTLKRLLCVLVTLVGAVLVSGVLKDGDGDWRGILLGLGAALLYASIVLINKKLKGIGAYDKTVVQLAVATVVLLVYTLLAEDVAASAFTPTVIALLFLAGVLHTGIAYALYFGSVGALPAQTVAIFSYIDPAVAVLLSALVLREPIGPLEIVGAVLILGAAVMGEVEFKKKEPISK